MAGKLVKFLKALRKADIGSIIYYAVEVIGVVTLLISLWTKVNILFGSKKTDSLKKDLKKDSKKA